MVYLQSNCWTTVLCLMLLAIERVHGLTAPLAPAGPIAPIATSKPTDLILSSGLLAFARHAGMLEAVEDSGIHVSRVVGTSSGSLAGALYCAGYTSTEIARELARKKPVQLIRPVLNPRSGLFSLRSMISRLREILPRDFSELQFPLAVGVYETGTKQFELISSGDLPEAVAASCAIPYVFQPVPIGSPERLMADGGYVDRVGLSAWSKWGSQSGPRKAIIHLITSTKSKTISNTYVGGGSTYLPFHGNPRDLSEVLKGDSSSLDAYVHIVRSPKANASFFNLRDFDTQKLVSYGLAMKSFSTNEFKEYLTL